MELLPHFGSKELTIFWGFHLKICFPLGKLKVGQFTSLEGQGGSSFGSAGIKRLGREFNRHAEQGVLALRVSVVSVMTEVERGWGWMEGIQLSPA